MNKANVNPAKMYFLIFIAMLACGVPIAGMIMNPSASTELGEPKKTNPLEPGLHECTLEGELGTYRYTVYVPERYVESDNPLPLAYGLHYGGYVSPFYSKAFVAALVRPGLKKIDPIIVAPDSIGDGWADPANEQMFLEIYEHVMKTYRVDTSRTVLTGFSMGGHGTWYLGGKHQDKFKAAIPIAGRPTAAYREWKIPVLAIHSDADKVVPIEPTQKYVEEMKELDQPVSLKVVEGLPHRATESFQFPLQESQEWLQAAWHKFTPN